MKYFFDPKTLELINSSEKLSQEERRELFKTLATKYNFVLIPITEGFPHHEASKEEINKYKAPFDKNWSRYSYEKQAYPDFDKLSTRAGAVCGQVPGIICLDIDDTDSFKKWLEDNDVQIEWPATLTIKSGGGERFHLYYKFPQDGKDYRSRSVGGIFDIKANGGMVICPGSLHPVTKKAYSVYDNLPIADAPQWLKHYSLDKKIFKKTTKENKVALDIVRDENGVIDIEQLPLSDDIKEKIRTPFPEGQRSEPSWSVLLSLINHGMSEQDIRDIYSQNPIGDKAKSNPDWFNKEIEKAFKRKSAIDKPKKENPYDKMFCCSLDKIKNADMHFEYIIEGFWPKGENLLITGKGGSGKSLFALNMALDLALPGNNMFLDTFKINKPSRKIMFLQSENTVHGTKMRVKNILSKYRQYNSSISNIYFIGMDQDIRIFGNFKEDNMLRKKIGDFIESVKPDVIFIDPLISYHAANENSNDEMRQVLDDLSQFFSAFEVDICIIHHDSKTGTSHARGASAIMDWAANAYSIEKKDSLYNLKHQKARNFSVNSDITLSFDHFKFLNFQGSGPGQSISQGCLDILSVIDAEPNKSFSSQKDFFKKYQQKFGSKASSHSKFMKDTDVLIAQGLISETNQGKSKVYTRN